MRSLVPERLLRTMGAEAAARLELPHEFVREGRRRVRAAAAIGVLVYAAFLVFGLARLANPTPFERRIDTAMYVLGLAVCGAVFLVSLVRQIQDHAVLAVALAGEIVISAIISIETPWVGFSHHGHVPSLTWVVPVIILFPLLVPASPVVTALVSLTCAATVPAGLAMLSATGAIATQPADYWSGCLAAAIGVAIALAGSATIYNAGRRIAAARQVGSYELLERLGQGGMGEVWKARHSLLARPAAVKLILPERLSGASEARDAAVQRFTREAQVTANLRSPHTVALFDFGTSAEGTFYYAMELLSGMNAEHFVYQFGPLEPRRAVSWLQQACHSLGEAHANRLVHRDIKPANLYVCQYGRDADFVKILDFGITKPTQTAPDDLHLTTPGERMGTPGYMAPEQVFGLEVDARTDLYALGCVGFFLLTGKKPFEAATPGELFRLHAQAAPPRVSDKAQQPIPPQLEAVIMNCLAKDPTDRPATADQLCLALGCLESAAWTAADAQTWWKANIPTA